MRGVGSEPKSNSFSSKATQELRSERARIKAARRRRSTHAAIAGPLDLGDFARFNVGFETPVSDLRAGIFPQHGVVAGRQRNAKTAFGISGERCHLRVLPFHGEFEIPGRRRTGTILPSRTGTTRRHHNDSFDAARDRSWRLR